MPIRRRAQHLSNPRNGWNILTGALGSYSADYTFRATIALVGLGANRPEEAIYPMASVDGDGKSLDGRNHYVFHFPPRGQTPPVEGFWSVTLYDDKGFPVANPLNGHAIGDRDRRKFNDDGSLTLYLQHASPGAGKEAN